MVQLQKKNKGLVVKLFDYFAAMKEIKFVSNIVGIKKSRLDFVESSVSSNLFFIITKETAHIVAISGYDNNPTLLGYHESFKARYGAEFKEFDQYAHSFASEFINVVNFLEINDLNLEYYSSVSYEYLLFMSGKEYKIKQYTYLYKNTLANGTVTIYKQDFYIINKDHKLYLMGVNFPSALGAIFGNLNLSNRTADEFINHDLERIYNGITALMQSNKKKDNVFVTAEYILDMSKKYYLDTYYHGWYELGFPTTKEEVQLLKMIAI